MLEDSVTGNVMEYNNITTAFANVHGRRKTNEDTEAFFINDEIAAFAIFDGHAGHICSKFIADTLLRRLIFDHANINAIFIELDAKFKELFPFDYSGTTATIVIIKKNKIKFINLGDSIAFLARDRKIIYKPTILDPTDAGEDLRIRRAGLFVSKGRIFGSLAVSRAFGDHMFKTDPFEPTKNAVSVIPEISEWIPLLKDDLIIMNCDGLNENGITNEDVLQFFNRPNDLLSTVIETIDNSLRVSGDNISMRAIKIIQGNTKFRKSFYFPGMTLNMNKELYEQTALKNSLTLTEALEMRKTIIEKFIDGKLDSIELEIITRRRYYEHGILFMEVLNDELRQLKGTTDLKISMPKSLRERETPLELKELMTTQWC